MYRSVHADVWLTHSKDRELTKLENAVGDMASRWKALAAGQTKKLEAAQCAALKVVGPHGLEPWTKGL